MDTSEQYIMMVDCPDIQDEHEWKTGDIFAERSYVGVFIEDESYIYDIAIRKVAGSENDIWLPDQSQLQEMVFPDTATSARQVVEYIYDFVRTTAFTNLFCPSMEQLLICFVMHELHNKVWNGEAWISV